MMQLFEVDWRGRYYTKPRKVHARHLRLPL